MQTQWITSMEVFAPLIMPVLNLVNPHVIGEIGAAEGGNTRVLYEFLKQKQGRLITIDPFPRGSFTQWAQASSDVVTHFAEFSLNCIPKAGAVDVWFIDGDHNWFTVFNELAFVDELSKQHHIPAIMFMHDVSWPCARRDMYYNPEQIPAEFVQPNSNQLGLTLDKQASPSGGLKGPYWALQEGGPRNGVLTAVEDFLQACSTNYYWFHVPVMLGLGVLVDKRHPHAETIANFYQPYHQNPIMEMVERDRISQYLAAAKLNEKFKQIASVIAE
jgi:hypothetical protein